MATVSAEAKRTFRVRRYMDDCLLIYRAGGGGREDNETVREFEKKCYLPPLKLEEAEAGVFLETLFACAKDGTVTHRLKNKNAGESTPRVWRYHRYDSYVPHLQKLGVVMGVLQKVARMASDVEQFVQSARDKLWEFAQLGYPVKLLRLACFRMYGSTTEPMWAHVAHGLKFENSM